jgi:biopolymer transport protein ExbD
MTPMIDVIFQLLIFFVCTASFQPGEELLPGRMEVSGGGVPAEPQPPELEDLERVVIQARRGEPAFAINGLPCADFAALVGRLRQIAAVDTQLPVIVDVEGDVPLGVAIDVYDACRGLGLASVRFAAEAAEAADAP